MKRSLITLLLFACFGTLCLADTTPATPAPAPVAVAPTQSPKDALLSFVLDKAKSYSGTMEESVGKAVDFAKEQAGPTTIEYLRWKAWENGVYGFLPLGILIIALSGSLYGFHRANWDIGPTVPTIMAIIGAVASFALTMTAPLWIGHILNVIEINVAPRVFLIEQVTNLIRR